MSGQTDSASGPSWAAGMSGIATMLSADVDNSVGLPEAEPEIAAAIMRLGHVVGEVVAARGGVCRPQGEGHRYLVAFTRASDAVAAALQLQRAPLAPIRLCIGVHAGELQPNDEENYPGPAGERAEHLRALAHGGQTLLSGAVAEMVADRLPEAAWLEDLGTHRARDLPRAGRVVGLCHPDLVNEFPRLRGSGDSTANHLATPLTRFVGREAELSRVRKLLDEHRLVTLTGAGGIGKTRLAIQIAAQIAGEFGDGVAWVDLAPIGDADAVPAAVARTLGLPDQPGRSTMDSLARFVADNEMLIVLDNCEHLLQASAELAEALLAAAPGLTVLATSREPIGVPGEASWRVPPLSLDDEALELFVDRARHAQPDFALGDYSAATVAEICTRLDGMPLAIELAAARVGALSAAEILEGLDDRLRLLTGGARTVARRQQTLRASVDWSHALLTDPERVLFRRLGVFVGGFDRDAAEAVAGDRAGTRHEVLEQLGVLVDKSLVMADNRSGRTRYWLLETIRQYAAEKLQQAEETHSVRRWHRDHYTTLAARLNNTTDDDYQRYLDEADVEIDNLRTAFACSVEDHEIELALKLASSLQPLWQSRSRMREGGSWFDTVFAAQDVCGAEVTPAVLARALADQAMLGITQHHENSNRAEQALAIARDLDDPALLAHALIACGTTTTDPMVALPHLAEAQALAGALDDRAVLSHIYGWQTYGGILLGDPLAARAAGEKGRDVAEAIGNRFAARWSRLWLGLAQLMLGELRTATARFRDIIAEAEAAHDTLAVVLGRMALGYAFAHRGETDEARCAADDAVAAGRELAPGAAMAPYSAVALAALAAGDAAAARCASEALVRDVSSGQPGYVVIERVLKAQSELASGDAVVARRWADDAVATTMGWYRMLALTVRARAARAQGELDTAERDLLDALVIASEVQAGVGVADVLECLAGVRGAGGGSPDQARLYGAAHAIRERIGETRFAVYRADYDHSVADLREALGDSEFDAAWTEGAALPFKAALAYAARGRGGRKRPSSGWASLTPTERDVARLVSEGLPNKDIATRLFISPRTVQTHLTRVYNKLGVTNRVQLTQEAARNP